MDKDLMAKGNEVLKANGRRELSLDELDKVNGGSFTYDPATGICTVNGRAPMTAAQFNDAVRNMARTYGAGAAIGWLRETTGFMGSMANHAGNETGEKADEIMGVVLDHFWRVYGSGN